MNHRIHIAFAAAIAASAIAQEPTQSLSTVQVQSVYYVADCGHRGLPSQRQVGEWTGQSNFSQVYATRQRLMNEIGRACRRPEVERVQLVMQQARPPLHDARLVASAVVRTR